MKGNKEGWYYVAGGDKTKGQIWSAHASSLDSLLEMLAKRNLPMKGIIRIRYENDVEVEREEIK